MDRQAMRETSWCCSSRAHHADAEFSAKSIFNLALQGDEDAKRIYRRVGRALGIVLSTLVNSLNLPIYVVGGGVASGWEVFAPAIFEELRHRCMVYAATPPADPLAHTAAAPSHLDPVPAPHTL